MLFNPRINGETVFDVRKLAAGQESRRSFAKEKMSKKSRDRCRRLLQKKKEEKEKKNGFVVALRGRRGCYEGKQIINSLLISAWYKEQAAKSLVKSIITGDKFCRV